MPARQLLQDDQAAPWPASRAACGPAACMRPGRHARAGFDHSHFPQHLERVAGANSACIEEAPKQLEPRVRDRERLSFSSFGVFFITHCRR